MHRCSNEQPAERQCTSSGLGEHHCLLRPCQGCAPPAQHLSRWAPAPCRMPPELLLSTEIWALLEEAAPVLGAGFGLAAVELCCHT